MQVAAKLLALGAGAFVRAAANGGAGVGVARVVRDAGDLILRVGVVVDGAHALVNGTLAHVGRRGFRGRRGRCGRGCGIGRLRRHGSLRSAAVVRHGHILVLALKPFNDTAF